MIMARPLTDPMERIIAAALDSAGIAYERPEDGLDFRIGDVWIEVKQFHSPRIARQMQSQRNVIAIQGREAAELFAHMLIASRKDAVRGG